MRKGKPHWIGELFMHVLYNIWISYLLNGLNYVSIFVQFGKSLINVDSECNETIKYCKPTQNVVCLLSTV